MFADQKSSIHIAFLGECGAKYAPFQLIPSIGQFFLIHFISFGLLILLFQPFLALILKFVPIQKL